MTDHPTGERPHEARIDSRRAFDGKLLHVRVDDVRLPSGRESVREIVEHPGSVVIVPLTPDDEVLLIRQYRYTVGRVLLELPAGLIDPGEAAEAAARRELIEETGYQAATMTRLTVVYVSPGYSEEQTTFYLAEGCVPVTHQPDQDEPIELVRVGRAEIPSLLIPGDTRVVNAQAMLGLLWLLRRDQP